MTAAPPRRVTRTRSLALCAALAGCAWGPPRPPTLPPPEATIEARAAAYHTHAASLDIDLWSGLQVRRGQWPEAESPGAARAWLSASPQAAQQLTDRETYYRSGIVALVLGVVSTVTAVAGLPVYIDSSGGTADLAVPTLLIGVGLAGTIIGSFLLAAAERCVPRAVASYNDWLWQALRLPQGASMGFPAVVSETGATLVPAEGPSPGPTPAVTVPSPW